MAQLFKNNAYSALAASLTNVATTLTVTTGHGDRFPAVTAPDFFMLTLQDASNNIEVVRVTARTAGADSMTITRAQEGTTARAWNIGDVTELRLTASALNPLGLFEGGATTAALRTTLDVPTRTGGDASGTWAINISGNAATATLAASATALQTARTINGASFNGTANITVDPQVDSDEATNATNYLVFVAGSAGGFQRLKEDTGLTYNPSTNTLTVAQVAGNAATVTNGVYTTGDQTIGGVKTFSSAVNFSGNDITVSGVAPTVNFSETDQTLPAGRRRFVLDGDVFTLRRNTAAGGDYSTFSSDMTVSATGDLTMVGNVTAYSDIRLKTDLTKISNALAKVNQLNGYTYTRLDSGERQTGVVAQEVQAVLPEAVIDGGEHLAVAYGNMVGLLIEAVKELTARVEKLEGR